MSCCSAKRARKLPLPARQKCDDCFLPAASMSPGGMKRIWLAISMRPSPSAACRAPAPPGSKPSLRPFPICAPSPSASRFGAIGWPSRSPRSARKLDCAGAAMADFRVDPRRSIPPLALLPLAKAPLARYFCLQKDAGKDELPPELAARTEIFVEDFDAGAHAFLDTAAVMANLDLIVTCDTSIAHLAGALGRPVWVALRHISEWRWMNDRSDLPWHPTMRLFRCAEGDDWAALFETIAGEIGR